VDLDRLSDQLSGLAGDRLSWPDYVAAADAALRKFVAFDRSCWHTIDPGTVLMTGSVNRNVSCSGSWLAEHEYVIEDVNKWSYLAQSGRLAGATSQATHGDLMRSARHRSHREFGIADELRISLVDGNGYWAAVGLLRDEGRPWYSEGETSTMVRLSAVLARGARSALISVATGESDDATIGPGVVIFSDAGEVESMTPSAELWISRLFEDPPPDSPLESKALLSVAARARAVRGADPLLSSARSRVRTVDGTWLLMYGSPLSSDGRTAVVIQQASPAEVAPLVALAYGLTEREAAVTRMCIEGRATKEIAASLHLSAYTVQDHLKAIFEKTGVRSRGELVGQVFLEHYLPRWEPLDTAPAGWHGFRS
jgi:DNA-binding CsgD family transcriptional regulator